MQEILIGIVVGLILSVSNYFIIRALNNKEKKVAIEMITRELKVLVRSLFRMNGWGKEFEVIYDEEWDRYEVFDERKKKVKDTLK